MLKMRVLPLNIGIVHFIGIGGIGMSGIAEILVTLGYEIQGSDIAENANIERLRRIGVTVMIGHNAENVKRSSFVVISSAIIAENPELRAARKLSIPIVRRAEMLGELMRFKWSIAVGGTHGKTTTTSLIGTVLDSAGYDPTVINGGIINAWGSNAKLGNGEWMVCEADESDGSFLKLPSTIAVITNIDPEHLDYYGSYAKLFDAFISFAESPPFYGFTLLCIDQPEMEKLHQKLPDRRVVTYGLHAKADVRGVNIRIIDGKILFDINFAKYRGKSEKKIVDVELPMLGEHNVQNTLAAVAIANEMNIDNSTLKGSLAKFSGVKRRFTQVGKVNGVTIIDDYGHHPTEILAVLKAAKLASSGKVIAVVQPHRYTRLRDLFMEFCQCFNDADSIIIADVYPAGEQKIKGISKKTLTEGIRSQGHKSVFELPDVSTLAELVSRIAVSGDYVVFLGAGNITEWANALPKLLEDMN